MGKARFEGSEGFGRCVCCGHRVRRGYRFCLGCHRKRQKILEDYRKAGLPEDWAQLKVDAAYPLRFEPKSSLGLSS